MTLDFVERMQTTYPGTVVYNLEVAIPRGVVNHFWTGRLLIFYVHSCTACA